MQLSIAGYSFHRLLEAGQQDIFKYITDCRDLGATQLDPWNEQLTVVFAGDLALRAANGQTAPGLSAEEKAYLLRMRQAAEDAGLPFGCLAVDGAHIYEPEPAEREINRLIADRWLEAAEILGSAQIRIDAGGPEEMPEDVFAIIVAGYKELLQRAAQRGVEVLMENHWGPSVVPDNVIKILDAVEGLGLLYDTNNWDPNLREQGWERCARYAKSTHIKTFSFDEQGNEASMDVTRAIRLVLATGYQGCWGIESCPEDGDEYGAVKKTTALIRRTLEAAGAL